MEVQEGAYGLWKPGVAGSIPAHLTDEEERRSRERSVQNKVVEGWWPVRADISDVLGSIPRATTEEKKAVFREQCSGNRF